MVRVLLVAALLAGGCAAESRDVRPSFLIVVLDTTRRDAVSAYGAVQGTTPAFDALAAAGLLYGRAYAQASWTLPSHATLFTGLESAAHGVSWERLWADEELVMLAERLRDAGWQTVSISENPWITPHFNVTQGFDRITYTTDAVGEVPKWIAQRSDAPFFLFVNVFDAHHPYAVREQNRFLPSGSTAADARAIPEDLESYFCRGAVRDPDQAKSLGVFRGLYLGDVNAADAKLGQLRTMLRDADLTRDLITIVTSDHGEAFGEHDQVGHLVGVSEALARVPLVVHGAPSAAPARLDAPVQLADVYASVLAWAGLGEPPAGRRPLPLRAAPVAPARDVVVHWKDPAQVVGASPSKQLSHALRDGRERLAKLREACTAGQDLFGSRTAFIRLPWKLVLGPADRARLYDVVRDPDERRDVAAAHADVVAALRGALAEHQARQPPPPRTAATIPEPPADVRERLRALGYLDAP